MKKNWQYKNEMLFFNTWSIINELRFFFSKDSFGCRSLLRSSSTHTRHTMHSDFIYFHNAWTGRQTHNLTLVHTETYCSQCVMYRLFCFHCRFSCFECLRRHRRFYRCRYFSLLYVFTYVLNATSTPPSKNRATVSLCACAAFTRYSSLAHTCMYACTFASTLCIAAVTAHTHTHTHECRLSKFT